MEFSHLHLHFKVVDDTDIGVNEVLSDEATSEAALLSSKEIRRSYKIVSSNTSIDGSLPVPSFVGHFSNSDYTDDVNVDKGNTFLAISTPIKKSQGHHSTIRFPHKLLV